MINIICEYFITNHHRFIKLFFLLYFLLGLLVIFSFFIPQISLYSNFFGQLSLLTYISTLLPGIAKRFNISFTPFNVLFLYRRHTGITMYLFALTHMVLSGVLFSTMPFVIFSQMAMIILFFLFITSNNYSLSKLSHHWYLLQKLTYVVMFLIFLHVALIDFGTLSLLLLLTIILEIISFIYHHYFIITKDHNLI